MQLTVNTSTKISSLSEMTDTASNESAHADEPAWQQSPLACFDAWLTTQDFAQSSSEIYQVQWQQFVVWLSEQRIALSAVEPDTVERFLINLDIKQDQRQRYLRLIERVFNYLRRNNFGTANPATQVALHPEHDWTSVPPNEPTGFLSTAEHATLVTYLSATPPQKLTIASRWRTLRDRTIVATFAGAGLKMSELQGLTLNAVNLDQALLTVFSTGTVVSHRAQLQTFAQTLLKHWLDVREQAQTAGNLVFPATREGRTMHKATVLRATTEQIKLAGISQDRDERASPQTLRNTYAANLFETDASIESIAETMGFKQIISAQRLKGAWETWAARCHTKSI